MITKHLIIKGRVQGVSYRAWSEGRAKSLGLTGWVRNRHDGTVEAIIQGPADKLQKFIEACHEGPPFASVTDVITNDYSGDETFINYEIKPTE